MDVADSFLQQTFLEEAEQLIADAEACLLQLEKGESRDAVAKVFRLVHSLKGSARAVGFGDMGAFLHEVEAVLVKLKNGEMEVTREVMNFLLGTVDKVSEMVRTLRQNPEARFPVTALLSSLHMPSLECAAPPQPDVDVVFNEEELQRYRAVNAVARSEATPKEAHSPDSNRTGDDAIRVHVGKIDRLINCVGELVILQGVLSEQRSTLPSRILQSTVAQLDKITREIQDTSMSLRMLPVRTVFQKMQRIVRDTAASLEKSVELVFQGEDTELDKRMIELMSDPMVHLVRNAVDHGIETNEERCALAKPLPAIVTLKAYHHGNRVVVEVCDNGGGLNLDRIVAKAKEKGLIPADATPTEEEAKALVFLNGFSTREAVSEISGRGVGMDVVKTNVEALGGDIEVESIRGQGSTFRMRLPLTLAIVDAMVVRVGKERYVVPAAQVHESLRPGPDDVKTIGGRGECLLLREESMPLLHLRNLLHSTGEKTAAVDGIAIVVRDTKMRPFAVMVDDIVAKQQVVIKRLGEEIGHLRGISGGAILGDAKAALIIDLLDLVQANGAAR